MCIRDRVLGETAGHLQKLGAVLKTGPDYLENLDADIILRTPGMPYTLPQLAEYRANGVTVTSEMEVFFDLCPAKLIGVTGSDGKTTTTTLIAEMLKAQGHTCLLYTSWTPEKSPTVRSCISCPRTASSSTATASRRIPAALFTLPTLWPTCISPT